MMNIWGICVTTFDKGQPIYSEEKNTEYILISSISHITLLYNCTYFKWPSVSALNVAHHLAITQGKENVYRSSISLAISQFYINPLKPTGHLIHQQFNIQQLYVLPTLYLCVLYLSENEQRLVPLTA